MRSRISRRIDGAARNDFQRVRVTRAFATRRAAMRSRGATALGLAALIAALFLAAAGITLSSLEAYRATARLEWKLQAQAAAEGAAAVLPNMLAGGKRNGAHVAVPVAGAVGVAPASNGATSGMLEIGACRIRWSLPDTSRSEQPPARASGVMQVRLDADVLRAQRAVYAAHYVATYDSSTSRPVEARQAQPAREGQAPAATPMWTLTNLERVQ